MKFCPECGSDLHGSTKFCPECGFGIGKVANAASNTDDDKGTSHTKPEVPVDTGKILASVDNCLSLDNTIEGYSNLLLKNKDTIATKHILTFNPYYRIQFTVEEEFYTPDKEIHNVSNSGKYIVNGLTNEMMCCVDDNGEIFHTKGTEQEQISKDLVNIEPAKTVNVHEVPELEVNVQPPKITSEDAEGAIRNQIITDNAITVTYGVKTSSDKEKMKKYTHTPSSESIQMSSSMIHVPKLDITFKSKKHTYKRSILPASGLTITDEISECKHTFSTKHTFAVCVSCGIAKCQDDILVDKRDMCYCKMHAPPNLKKAQGTSFTSSLRSLRDNFR